MNSRSGASRPTRSNPVAALALLAALMAVALVLWRVLPQPRGWLTWAPIAAALLAGWRMGGGAVLSVRNIAVSGGAFLLCQLAIQLLLATRVIAA